MNHHCHYYGCNVKTSPALLTCPAHWRLVSQVHKDSVWRTYKDGKKAGDHPTMEWQVATELAFLDIAKAEQHELQDKRIAFCEHKVKFCKKYLRMGIENDAKRTLPEFSPEQIKSVVDSKYSIRLDFIKPGLHMEKTNEQSAGTIDQA